MVEGELLSKQTIPLKSTQNRPKIQTRPTIMTVPTGEFIAEHLTIESNLIAKHYDGTDLVNGIPSELIQPNGVDIPTEDIYRVSGSAVFSHDGYARPGRTWLEVNESLAENHNPSWRLPPGNYIIKYGVEFKIPDGYVGRMYPRSRVMRCGLHLTSALWDQGYHGRGEGMLQVPAGVEATTVVEGTPLAQFTLLEADEAGDYDGSHQGEGL